MHVERILIAIMREVVEQMLLLRHVYTLYISTEHDEPNLILCVTQTHFRSESASIISSALLSCEAAKCIFI